MHVYDCLPNVNSLSFVPTFGARVLNFARRLVNCPLCSAVDVQDTHAKGDPGVGERWRGAFSSQGDHTEIREGETEVDTCPHCWRGMHVRYAHAAEDPGWGRQERVSGRDTDNVTSDEGPERVPCRRVKGKARQQEDPLAR